MSKARGHGKKDAASYRDRLERVFRDDPVPENIDNEDEITRIMMNRLESYRQRPMTDAEISQGQQAILDAFGTRPPTNTQQEEHAQGVTAPFIIHCGRIADAVTTMHYRPGRASNRLIQESVFRPSSDLAESLIYTTGESFFAPVRFMVESGRIPSTTIVTEQAQITRSTGREDCRIPLHRFVAMLERATGFGLEGGIAARTQGILCLVMDHIDTAQFACLVVLRFDKTLTPAASVDAASVYGTAFAYELFDAPFLTREGTPWAALHVGYVDAFYFDRVEAPYGRLVADTRNV